jgi:hypothetical protein
MSLDVYHEACDTPTCIRLVGEEQAKLELKEAELGLVEAQLRKTYDELNSCRTGKAPPVPVPVSEEPLASSDDYFQRKSPYTSHFTAR